MLEPILKPLWHAYEVMKRGRERRQPLELDMPERKILLKPDGTVDRVSCRRGSMPTSSSKR
jgi:ribonuclease R